MSDDKFIIQKSNPLRGEVKISGSKNSVLPIMAAALLTRETCVIRDVPQLSDVYVLETVLRQLNTECSYDDNTLRICAEKTAQNALIDCDLIGQIRASFLVMGALLARFCECKIPLPGGCTIGTRPIDLHLKGFAAMGAVIDCSHGCVYACAKNGLSGARIYLDFPSVGATENIMIAAATADGTTIIENCAEEPEIVDLANFLNSCGANVRGAGTDAIKIKGVPYLHGCDHTIIPDRIEAGTFMIAAAVTRGNILLQNIVPDHLKPITAKLKETGVLIHEEQDGIRVIGENPLNGVDIKTLPYPGFPTDLQAPFMSLLASAQGNSVVTETVFENRFLHVSEFKRMGAQIKIDSRTAIIDGVQALTGAPVRATDLRAGAALILNALAADGQTEISGVRHIDRGYCRIEDKFMKLGARIRRV
ncbi:UDP-N-acetylglucosamine 1-carboxyvinyltransferase [Clostridia bacterium]|nr:UDP-N-acetylglucosamine 1-carboxyvinyltransferase [Clostridia bacterium]